MSRFGFEADKPGVFRVLSHIEENSGASLDPQPCIGVEPEAPSSDMLEEVHRRESPADVATGSLTIAEDGRQSEHGVVGLIALG